MALIETESLVLKSYNLSEADKIVVLLTHDHGVVRGVAKGAKRLKSKFGSGLEPFSIVRTSYFQKDSVELVSIERIDLIKSNFAAASDPAFLQKFSYLTDLLLAISPPHDPSETLYRMARACLQAASDNANSLLSIGVYFEVWLLRLGGYLPDWARCDRCREAFSEMSESSIGPSFHLHCANCRRGRHDRVMAAEIRMLAASVLRLSPGDFASYAANRIDDLNQLSGISKRMISEAIGREVGAELPRYTGSPA